jgi:hypothetical protein
MQLLRIVVVFACLPLVGCGGGKSLVHESTLKDDVQQFQTALMDARGTLQSVRAAAGRTKADEDEEREKPEVEITSVLQMVASSAEQLVRSAAGQPAEADAKAIQTDAQELLKKFKGKTDAAGALQGVEQLSSKTEALSAKL